MCAVLVAADAAAIAGGVAMRGWAAAAVAAGAVMMAAIALSGGYRVPIELRAETTLPGLLSRAALAAGALTPLVPRVRPHLWQIVATVAMLALARCIAYQTVRWARRRARLREPVLVLGEGVIADELRRIVVEHPEYGVDLVDGSAGTTPIDERSTALVGSDLDAWLRDTRVRTVIVAFSGTREAELVDVLRAAVANGIEVLVVPRFFDLAPGPTSRDVDELWGIPLQRVRALSDRTIGRVGKRSLDIALSLVLLMVLLPVFVLIAVAVKTGSPGPVLFRQQRVGQHGRTFDMLKFRSMYAHECSDTRWTHDAPAVTTVGRLLRRTNFDELPQLWNVLRGDMSLVGPRPERLHFVKEFEQSIPGYRARHRVPVGVTGLAQVNGLRGDTSIEERVRFDNRYIEHWSLWRDVTILARTVAQLLKGS